MEAKLKATAAPTKATNMVGKDSSMLKVIVSEPPVFS